MTVKTNNLLLIILLYLLTGCGFSSGLYQDIISAHNHINEQKYSEAAEIYEKILIKKPSKNIRIKINFQLGEIYSIYLGNYKKSIKHFETIVNDSNEPLWQVKSLEKIGEIYFENLNQYEKSKAIFYKLKNFVPPLKKQAQYTYKYALSVLNNKEYQEAIKELDAVIRLNNKEFSVLAYYYKGLAYYYKRDWENAISQWNEYLRRETRADKITDTKFLIANAYESSEKLKEAYDYYYSILGEYPNPDVIRNRLNTLYERRVSRKR